MSPRTGRFLPGLLLGGGAGCLALLLYLLPPFAAFEGVAVDGLVRWRGPEPADPRVVICAVDEAAIDSYGRWPWRRSLVAKLVRRLADDGAAVIALDVYFTEPSGAWPGFELTADDRELAEALAESERAVIAYFFREAPGVGVPEVLRPLADPRNVRPTQLLAVGAVEDLPVRTYPTVEPNLDLFAEAARSQGFGTGERESGVARRQPLVARHGGDLYPALALRAVGLFTGEEPTVRRSSRGWPEVLLGDRRVETDPEGRMMVNYRGAAGAVETVSAADVLAGAAAAGTFRDRLVFLGLTETGVGDVMATPFGTEVPGVEVHATVAENLLARRWIAEGTLQARLSLAALLAVALAVAFLIVRLQRPWAGFGGALLVVVGWVVVCRLALGGWSWHLQAVGPAVAGTVSMIASLGYQRVVVRAEARRIRRAFEHFVSQAIVDEMLRHPERLRLGGERRELTVLFSDIRGFTTIAEGLNSGELVQVLNQYFTPMTRLVLEEGGTLDKYMGDALMAFFGAPVALADHAARACRAALAMSRTLEGLNARWRAEGTLPEGAALGIGIGLNTGEMSVGNMGSEEVFDYTVIGDEVNLGSRIEGLNKLYGTEILVSEGTVRAVAEEEGDSFLFRELDRVRVKGKQQPVALYELMAERPAPPELEERARRFVRALALYRERRFAEAAEGFAALAREGDGPAAALEERAARLARDGAPADWEPVETLTTK